MKKEVNRTCLGCMQVKDKKDLIRIVKNKEDEIFLDKTGKANGRGAYICDDIKCLEKLKKSKRLNKVFKTNVEDNIYELLEKELSN